MYNSKELIKLARDSINSYFKGKKITTEKFPEKKGVFVTLYDKNENLHGCIGFIKPEHLGKNIIKAAISAAFHDPRFLPLKKDEEYKIEISILTEPELIKVDKPEHYTKKIVVGKDGLIANYKGFTGLLLPRVPVDFKWNVTEFLEHTCMKAGLSPSMWKDKGCKIYKFQAEVFKE